jgi:hypothetical protein
MKYVIQVPKQKAMQVKLEEESDGISVKVGDYYLCTILHTGELLLHRSVGVETGLKLDLTGTVLVKREDVKEMEDG